MNNMKRRVTRIEEKANRGEKALVTFGVRYGQEKEDFERQHKHYLEKGGNPNSLFVSIVNYAKGVSCNVA
ncbi:MAG: hypothetical protein M0P57_14990 [Syntrophales bacterium]|jgi:hypothetical protein|nr:hypothetical protein [Syntrophales bacterium]